MYLGCLRLLCLIMAALRSRCGHYMFVLFLSSFFLSFLFLTYNFSGRKSEMYCTRLAGNTGRKKRQKSPSRHHRTTLSGYVFAAKARIDNRKKTC